MRLEPEAAHHPVPARGPEASLASERRALELFAAAIEQPAADREAWLDRHCGADPLLRSRVRALLDSDLEDETQSGDGWSDSALLPPSQVGAYHLDELIGAGGMGSVYRASRVDGVFEQTVAVKFIRSAWNDTTAQALFDAERRVLARMQHPGIAHILDGGTTGNGLPYLVMEFVEGIPLDRHASSHALDLRARVALFCEACAAVAHAHGHLVLHCDIKPDNILVNQDGRTKLIDFGIARRENTLDDGMLAGFTRAYASPQRLRGEVAVVADDVFSLGVVLTELLSGTAPGRAHAGQRTAARRRDLMAIARKAAAEERTARYASVQALDDDLRNWLADRPVGAVPDTWGYRAAKLIDRHPWRVAAAAGALMGLIGALAVIGALYAQAEAARRVAEQRFAEVRSLARYMLFDLDPRLEATPGTTQARREMVDQAQRYLDTLAVSAGSNRSLQQEVAVGLARLAEVQGVPGKPHVGEPAAAKANLERAERLLLALTYDGPASGALERDLGRVRYLLALVSGARDNDPNRQLERASGAEAHTIRALDLQPNATPRERAELEVQLASTRLTQADAHKNRNEHAAALALQEGVEAHLLGLPEAVRAEMEFEFQSARPAMLAGDSLYYLDRRDDALAAYRRALGRMEAGHIRAPLNRRLLEGLLIGYWNISGTLADSGHHAEALATIDRAEPVVAQLNALDPDNIEARRLRRLVSGHRAIMLANLGRYDEAIRLAESTVLDARARALNAPDDAERARDLAVPLRTLASFHQRKGDTAGTCRVLSQAIAAWTDIDQRWGLSALDRRDELDTVREQHAAIGCR